MIFLMIHDLCCFYLFIYFFFYKRSERKLKENSFCPLWIIIHNKKNILNHWENDLNLNRSVISC